MDEATPRIELIGVYRLPITEQIMKIARSLRPSISEELHRNWDESDRAWLAKVVLVELRVDNATPDFDPFEIRPQSTDCRSTYDGVFLTPDGTARLVDQGEELPAGITAFRVTMYLRNYDESGPLLTPYKKFDAPIVSAMPERLQSLVSYPVE